MILSWLFLYCHAPCCLWSAPFPLSFWCTVTVVFLIEVPSFRNTCLIHLQCQFFRIVFISSRQVCCRRSLIWDGSGPEGFYAGKLSNVCHLTLISRYWSDYYLSHKRAVPSDVWCGKRLAQVPQSHIWDCNGRGQQKGWGWTSAERSQLSDSYAWTVTGSPTSESKTWGSNYSRILIGSFLWSIGQQTYRRWHH